MRYFSARSSSVLATASMSLSRAAAAASERSPGMSPTVALPSLYVCAFIVSRSTTPLKACSLPIGSCTATTCAPNDSWSSSSAWSKSARSRSSMLQTIMRPSPRASARSQSRSCWTSTPSTVLTTTSAVSTTCRLAMASARKLESPGVSMMLKERPSRSTCARPAERLIWRFFSSSSQSEIVVPSDTEPRRVIAPASNRSASNRDVLPVPRWPTRAMFLILAGSFIRGLLVVVRRRLRARAREAAGRLLSEG